jgi:AraC family transcriptional activator FtrA
MRVTACHGPLVVALGFRDAPMFELGIAAEVFGLLRPEFGTDWYRFALVSGDGQPVRTSQGWTLSVDGNLSLLADADLIVVPGWPIGDSTVPPSIAKACSDA